MNRIFIAGLAALALAACGKQEEAPQPPAPPSQSEQMEENNMAPMEEAQPQVEPSNEVPQAAEPGAQNDGFTTEEPMPMPPQTPENSTKE
jgi:hypothetical protein